MKGQTELDVKSLTSKPELFLIRPSFDVFLVAKSSELEMDRIGAQASKFEIQTKGIDSISGGPGMFRLSFVNARKTGRLKDNLALNFIKSLLSKKDLSAGNAKNLET